MKWTLTLALLISINSQASLHEDDLSSSTHYKSMSRDLSVDHVESFPIRQTGVVINAVILKNGVEEAIEGLNFNESKDLSCDSNNSFSVTADLELKKFKIVGDWNREYKLFFEGECSKGYKLIFKHDSPSGEYFKIRNIAYGLTRKLEEIDRVSFLSGKIKIKFPASGDYYNGTVHVTKGYQWDVVGHEIGHAIYSHARIGHSRGGSHRIDGCYSKELALSEGWASFFSAWLSVDLNDPMAKFEYMVPRRAPLEIEHVPSDVCVGPTNEWRVYSFLWDLIDLNNDNEKVEISFKDLWDISFKKNFPSIVEFRDELLKEGFDPILINVIWNQNIEGI